MLKIFKVNFIILLQPKHLWQYQWNMNMTELPVTVFSVDFKEIKTYHNRCSARARFVYNGDRAVVTEKRLKRLDYLEPWIFEFEFRDIFFQSVWHTRQALTKWRIKVPKANSRWYVEYVQLVWTEVDFHCSRTLTKRFNPTLTVALTSTMLYSFPFHVMAPALANATPSTSNNHRGKCSSPDGKALAKLPKFQSEHMEETPVYSIFGKHGLITHITHWNRHVLLQILAIAFIS